jgi:hypothetical protein
MNTSPAKSLQAKQPFGVASSELNKSEVSLVDLVAGSKDDFPYQICLHS